MEVIIKNRKYTRAATLDALKEEGWYVVDVTSKSGDESHRKFSPFYPHGNIRVGKYNSESVEGLWQGLKVFREHTIDESKFRIRNMKGLKRTVRKYGHPIGHHFEQDGVVKILSYTDARKQIFVPAYEQLLSRMETELAEIRKHPRILLLDYETNEDIEDINTPLSHASLVKKALLQP